MNPQSMKTTLRFAAACAVVMAVGAFAQYSVPWYTVDGGGGTSTGGVFAISGTIGQPDAGTMAGGNFTLRGGFWGIVAAVQTTNAPWLTVTRGLSSSVQVSWPGPEAGWRLQSAASLSGSPVWTEIAPPYAAQGTNLVFTEVVPSGNKFYRLHRP